MLILQALMLGLIILSALAYRGRTQVEGVSHAIWIPWIWVMVTLSRSPVAWFRSAPSDRNASLFTEGNPLEAAFFAVLILAAFIILNHRATRVRFFLRSNTPLLLYTGYCLLSLLWADDPGTGLKRLVKGFGTIAMVLVLLTEKNVKDAFERVLIWAAYILLPLSSILILFFPSIGTFYDDSTKITYFIGVATQKNELGLCSMVCGVSLLWAFLNAWHDRQDRYRTHRLVLNALMYILAFVLIKTCDSMTSFSCLIIASVVMLLIRRRGPTPNLHGMVFGMLALAVFSSFLDSSGTLLRLLGRNPSLTGRTEIWRAVLAQHTNPLIGCGFESFWTSQRIERVWQIIGYGGVAEAHNGYLEVYVNLGLVGLILLAFLIVNGYKNAVISYRADPALGQLKIALFTAALIFDLAEAGLRSTSSAWMILIFAIVQYIPPHLRVPGGLAGGGISAKKPGHRTRILQ
jgi:O-antigen ligase